ncbi:MAG TPA: LuxR C-terminal-related transcriptional regulator, partial [Dehalococcoidia bacterium]|nr:LuxR C-terminal-related transcriptional regulator [Dehalococcoidia bacterium]
MARTYPDLMVATQTRPILTGQPIRGRDARDLSLRFQVEANLVKRGRPPHEDVLTPAEWRVLAHLQLGRANAQIAIQLDISINTVRYHVANLLAKSGTANRRELAAWRPVGLSGARREAPSFRGDRFTAVRTLLSQIGVDGLGASPLDIIHGVQDIDPEVGAAVHASSADHAVTLFTGTVVGVGRVVANEVSSNDAGLLSLDTADLLPDSRAGDWLAVNGAALVMRSPGVPAQKGLCTLAVPGDVRRRTNIGALKPGGVVNLEPAARLSDRMSGHILSGRTDGTASLR